jgi:hypothetical protein
MTPAIPAPVVSSPLVHVHILASATLNGTYMSSLTVTPGEKVYYEVFAELSKVGTTHVVGTNTLQILHKTHHPGVGTLNYDGIGSLSFNLVDSGEFTGTFGAAALATNPTTGDNYDGFVSASNGAPDGAELLGVRGIQAPGRFAGATEFEEVLTGTFTVASNAKTGSVSHIQGKWGSEAGAIAINSNPKTGEDSTKVLITSATESSGNPLVVFAPFSLRTTPAKVGTTT